MNYLEIGAYQKDKRVSLFHKAQIDYESEGEKPWIGLQEDENLEVLKCDEEECKSTERNQQYERENVQSFKLEFGRIEGNKKGKTKIERRKSNRDSKGALFTKMKLDREDSF